MNHRHDHDAENSFDARATIIEVATSHRSAHLIPDLIMQGAVPAFPDRYASLPIEELFDAYTTGAARLERALTGLTDAQLRARPIAGKWSIIEIALHVVDAEVMGATRFRMAFAQPGATFVAYDQDVWANAFRYSETSAADLLRSLALVRSVRQYVFSDLRRVTGTDWTTLGGVHPERGFLTLRNLLELYTDHVDRHLEQVRERRRLLGLATDVVDVRLTTRLY